MTREVRTGVAVIGGGPGGYSAAFRAADLGCEVCLVEQGGRLGGTCLNVGCIPSKTLLHAASLIETAKTAAKCGITFAPPAIDIEKLREHKNAVVTQLTNSLSNLAKSRKVARYTGKATFLDDHTLLVATADDTLHLHFEQAIIATGSKPVHLPHVPDDERIWDSTRALSLEYVPGRLLIVGGGIIGLEMAAVYHALGAEITVVEWAKQIIPPADRDLVQPLFLTLKKQYPLHTETRVDRMTPLSVGIEVRFEGKITSSELFDAVLVAVGRQPNTENLGLANIGIKVDARGFIPVNQQQKTSLPHIYAVGDVVGNPMLAHKATHQGKVAAEVIAGQPSRFAPVSIPSVAYTAPEIAWVGMTEKDAALQGIAFTKGKFPWGASGRALSADVTGGVTKALFDTETGALLGAGICGAGAGELIHEAALALELGATAEQIGRTIHAHPTLAETFAGAAEVVTGTITDLLPFKTRG